MGPGPIAISLKPIFSLKTPIWGAISHQVMFIIFEISRKFPMY
jgi:hypothetical protein